MFVTPAAIAGDMRIVLWMRQKFAYVRYSTNEWIWFSSFFPKALVSRVKRRMPIRMLRFCRSTYDVLMCFGSGLPVTGRGTAPRHAGGL